MKQDKRMNQALFIHSLFEYAYKKRTISYVAAVRLNDMNILKSLVFTGLFKTGAVKTDQRIENKNKNVQEYFDSVKRALDYIKKDPKYHLGISKIPKFKESFFSLILDRFKPKKREAVKPLYLLK